MNKNFGRNLVSLCVTIAVLTSMTIFGVAACATGPRVAVTMAVNGPDGAKADIEWMAGFGEGDTKRVSLPWSETVSVSTNLTMEAELATGNDDISCVLSREERQRLGTGSGECRVTMTIAVGA